MANKKITQAESDAQICGMENVLEGFGADLSDQHFKKTPQRFLNYLGHYFQDYSAPDILQAQFSVPLGESHPIVIQKRIPFTGCCAHHLLPMHGHAHIGYIPRTSIVGLSKLTRLAYGVGHSTPATQEFYTDQIADELMEYLEPVGAIVVTDLAHGCMRCRGVEVENTTTICAAVRGAFSTTAQAREEFYRMLEIST